MYRSEIEMSYQHRSREEISWQGGEEEKSWINGVMALA